MDLAILHQISNLVIRERSFQLAIFAENQAITHIPQLWLGLLGMREKSHLEKIYPPNFFCFSVTFLLIIASTFFERGYILTSTIPLAASPQSQPRESNYYRATSTNQTSI